MNHIYEKQFAMTQVKAVGPGGLALALCLLHPSSLGCNGPGDADTASSTAASTSTSTNPACTTITQSGQNIVDSAGNEWSLSSGVVLENGEDAGYSANVTQLAYVGGEIYQENSAGEWWGWSGGTWVSAPAPMGCSSGGTSASCTVVTTSDEVITDSQGNAWTLSGGVALENGADAGYSANVTALTYVNGDVYQTNSAGNSWVWSGGTWVPSTALSTSGCSTGGASPNCTQVSGPGQQITDAKGDVWTLSAGVVLENGADAGYSANVTALTYVNGDVYQTNSAGNSWVWSGGTWVSGTSPSVQCESSGGGPDSGTGSGQFAVVNGQLVAPDGSQFIARGIDIYASEMAAVTANGAPLTTAFPGLNMVRVYDPNYQGPSTYAAFIDAVTALGIVVCIVDTCNYDGNAGGSSGIVFTGNDLTKELAWYQSLATTFINNPRVWLGSNNEPSYNPSLAALATWQGQTYDAIRGTGNNNIIMMDEPGGGNPGTMGPTNGLTPSIYAPMTNIVWDLHYYGNGSNDQATLNAALLGSASSGSGIQGAQSMPADGAIAPVIIGEYGNSWDGGDIDGDWSQTVTAVTTSGYGSTAYVYPFVGAAGDALANGDGSLSPYGQQVAAYIATGTTGH